MSLIRLVAAAARAWGRKIPNERGSTLVAMVMISLAACSSGSPGSGAAPPPTGSGGVGGTGGAAGALGSGGTAGAGGAGACPGPMPTCWGSVEACVDDAADPPLCASGTWTCPTFIRSPPPVDCFVSPDVGPGHGACVRGTPQPSATCLPPQRWRCPTGMIHADSCACFVDVAGDPCGGGGGAGDGGRGGVGGRGAGAGGGAGGAGGGHGPGGAGGPGGAPGASAAGGRTQVASIVLSHSTNSPEVDVVVYADASAERTVSGPPGAFLDVTPATYAAGSAEGASFLADLRAAGDVSTIPTAPCLKSVSFGTTLKVTAGGLTSGDLECGASTASPAQMALIRDCVVLIGGQY